MKKNELTFYWYPTNNSGGVNFEKDKEYTIENIISTLKEKNKNEINGFFINYGKPVGENRFNRIIIERGTTNIFKLKEQQFSKVNYENYLPPEIQSALLEREFDSEDIKDHLGKIFKNGHSIVAKSASMLEEFNIFSNDSDE